MGGALEHLSPPPDRAPAVVGQTVSRSGPDLRTVVLSPATVMSLQSSAGNQAVAAMIERNTIQRKANERAFSPAGRVDEPRVGEVLFWNLGVGQDQPKKEHRGKIKEVADHILDALKEDPSATVDVEGLASSTGSDKVNEPLARRRAEAMVTRLVALGVPQDHLVVSATGALKASASATAEDMARDRAVRVVLAPRIAAPKAGRSPVAGLQILSDLSFKTTPVTFTANQVMAGTPSTPGITFSIRAQQPRPKGPPPPGAVSSLVYVQNVMPWREVTFKDGSRARMERVGFVLDSTDPYDSVVDSSFLFIFEIDAFDGPTQGTGASNAKGEGTIASVEVRDEFRMWVLAKRFDGTRLPLRVARWSWVGRVRNTTSKFGEGRLVLDSGVSRVVPTTGAGVPTSETPLTSPNVTSVNFVADNRGVPSGLSLAELLIGKGIYRPPSKKA